MQSGVHDSPFTIFDGKESNPVLDCARPPTPPASVIDSASSTDAASGLRFRQSQRGHNMALAASGGLEVSHTRDSENTSLISTEGGSTRDGQANRSNTVERRGEFKWQGENNFEGMSWWEKPSSTTSAPGSLNFKPEMVARKGSVD